MEVKNERLQELTENIEQILWMTVAKTSAVLYVSPAYKRMFGRSWQSLIKEPESFLTVVHPPEDEPMLQSAGANMAATGHMNLECRVLGADGEYRWVWMRGYPVMKEGEIVRIVFMIFGANGLAEAHQVNIRDDGGALQVAPTVPGCASGLTAMEHDIMQGAGGLAERKAGSTAVRVKAKHAAFAAGEQISPGESTPKVIP